MLAIRLALALVQADAQLSTAQADPRIRLVAHNPDEVVTLSIAPGFAAVVELAPDERVDNLVVGNSSAWEATANRSGDRVIVKPVSGASPTNMIILTGSRRYVFLLDPGSNYEVPTSFVLRFSYPEAAASAAAAPSRSVVASYRFRGDRALFPRAMYQDGARTVISWDKQAPLPAIFAMDGGRGERLVNGRMVGDDFIVEGNAARYKFRFGSAEATAIRHLPKRRR